MRLQGAVGIAIAVGAVLAGCGRCGSQSDGASTIGDEDDAGRQARHDGTLTDAVGSKGDAHTCRFGIYLATDRRPFSRIGRPHVDDFLTKSEPVLSDEDDLEPVPVLSDKDILAYEWETHTMTLVPSAIERLPRPGAGGIQFVVVADGERCYAGAFWSSMSSMGCSLPVIRVDRLVDPPPEGSLRIDWGYPGRKRSIDERDDPRSDPRVKKCLEELGKLD